MASNKIKGLTVEIGGDTTKLGKALENVNKKSRDLSSELGQINKLLKLDPGNADLLAQKQKVLADAVSNTAKKLETLEEAERQVQAQFERGEVSEEQVRELQREIIATTNKLDNYKNAAKETADAIDRLGDDAKDAGDDIDKVGNESKETQRETEDLGSALSGPVSKGFTAVATVAAAASAAIVGCVEASHEYRTEMGKLDTAFTTNNYSSETAKNTYKELQSVLGETDQAVEAANHLAQLANNEEDLSQLTDALTGVYATFGASLPVEGLAEAANETAKVGQVTGSFADAINWATDEATDWKSILGSNKKALAAFNKATKEGEKTEDAYTAALEACSGEQERQKLITKTLTTLYGKAATQYKKTNKNIIEANKANEEWNETLAEVGDELSPVVTEVKKFGAELLENAKEPLKEIAGFLVDTVLPALSALINWVRNNLPVIKAGLVAVAAAIVTYKVATIAATVAQNGLKAALMATTAAQAALNAIQMATPWGLVAAGCAAVVGGIVALAIATDDASESVNVLTEEERELIATAEETADAFRDQQEETEKTMGGISSQMGHVQDLATELQTLADASGKVKEADEARAQFILNELNEALGTEYEMVDGVIQHYSDLKDGIAEVIKYKTANALLDAGNADYVAALEAKDKALEALVLAEKDYAAQKDVTLEAERKYVEENEKLTQKTVDNAMYLTTSEGEMHMQRVSSLLTAWDTEKQTLEEKQNTYAKAAENCANYSTTIMDYEDAQQAALEGNYERAVEILNKKSVNFAEYADDVDTASREAIDALYREAIDAGLAAERTKQNFEKGVKGYTQKMVDEAEKGYEDALKQWASAYNDASKVGTDLGDGLKAGMEGTEGGLIKKARTIVSSIIAAMRTEADSHSPSRKMIDFGEDMGEGADIGLENKTSDLLKTARKQVQRLMVTYQDEGEANSQAAVRGVAERASARSLNSMQTFIDGNNSKLDKILAAIERGQVLLLDGKALVGGTAKMTDEALGHRRALVARGAV